jgi:nucleotide-binding universal stress UspA family protein
MGGKMKDHNNIVVAFDLSQHAVAALKVGAQLAEDLHAELVIVNIINQRDVSAMEIALRKIKKEIDNFPVSIGGYVEGLKNERRKSITETVNKTVGDQVACRIVVATGVPFKRLIEVAIDESPRLIVIGTKGRSNLADVILGSTAEKMFRHCQFPLLSVRVTETEKNDVV